MFGLFGGYRKFVTDSISVQADIGMLPVFLEDDDTGKSTSSLDFAINFGVSYNY